MASCYIGTVTRWHQSTGGSTKGALAHLESTRQANAGGYTPPRMDPTPLGVKKKGHGTARARPPTVQKPIQQPVPKGEHAVAPEVYRELRKSLGTQAAVALLLGVGVRTLIRREGVGASLEARLALEGLIARQERATPQG